MGVRELARCEGMGQAIMCDRVGKEGVTIGVRCTEVAGTEEHMR